MNATNRQNSIIRLSLFLALLALLATLAPAAQPARAQGDPMAMFLPPGFMQERVVSGLDGPMRFDMAAEGRIFVTQKAGGAGREGFTLPLGCQMGVFTI